MARSPDIQYQEVPTNKNLLDAWLRNISLQENDKEPVAATIQAVCVLTINDSLHTDDKPSMRRVMRKAIRYLFRENFLKL